MTVTILRGDCIEMMRTMDAESVDCVVTSPPYWGLRDYGVEGQLGLEPTLGEHLDKMVEVFAEVHRILKQTGTLWLNYGDCYATTPAGHKSGQDGRIRPDKDDRTFTQKPFSTIGGVLKPKDLCMIPNRLAIALQEWGWWVRSEIIWAKPNPLPESVKDRPGTSHEKIFLLSKSQKYFYDHEAVQEPSVRPNEVNTFGGQKYLDHHISETDPMYRKTSNQWGNEYTTKEFRNLRNVWEIPTKSFSEAHFATFPPELAERCIKAGCPQDGVVFDPFGGAGTTGLVADRLQRDAILIELNPDYIDIAEKRIHNDAPLLIEVTA